MTLGSHINILPRERNPYCLFPSMVESFFIFCMVETWNCFFFGFRMIYPYIPTFFSPNHGTHWNQPVGTPKYAWFPQFVCYLPIWSPHDIHREIRCIMKSKNSLWTLSPKAMELPPHGSSTLFLGCPVESSGKERFLAVVRAGCGLEGCDNGCRDAYNYNTQTNWFTNAVTLVHMDWQLPIKDGHTSENFMLTLRSCHQKLWFFHTTFGSSRSSTRHSVQFANCNKWPIPHLVRFTTVKWCGIPHLYRCEMTNLLVLRWFSHL